MTAAIEPVNWDLSDTWQYRTSSQRRGVVIPVHGHGEPEEYPGWSAHDPTPYQVADAWSSQVASLTHYPSFDFHLPVLDVDVPHGADLAYHTQVFHYVFGGAVQWWQRSTNNWHVYIGAAPGGSYDRVMPWRIYSQALGYLSNHHLIDPVWAHLSFAQGESVVRKVGVRKPFKPILNCMWCGRHVHSVVELEEHEDACA